jgi:hypothetical protein
MTEGKSGGVFVGTAPPPGKPKGLLDAISEIQQYYVVERGGSTIPADFLTTKGKLGFFEVGFKGAFLSGLVGALFTPFAIGVVEKLIPIFGSREPSYFDQAFALMIAVSFSAGYAIMLSTVSRCYIGEISKAAIKNLVGGFAAGAMLKALLAFLLFHFLYLFLTPDRLVRILSHMTMLVPPEALNGWYIWLWNFRSVFLVSAWFVVVTTVLTIMIPVVTIRQASRKTRLAMEQEDKWH